MVPKEGELTTVWLQGGPGTSAPWQAFIGAGPGEAAGPPLLSRLAGKPSQEGCLGESGLL